MKSDFVKGDSAGRLIFDFDGWARTAEGRAQLKKLINHPITKAIKAGKKVTTDEFGLFISITEQ